MAQARAETTAILVLVNRLVAYIGNDPERIACALAPARPALHLSSPGAAADWGLGFVQSGDVLLQKRSRIHTRDIDFYDLARDLQADALMGRVAQEGTGTSHDDPFRFRTWLFGAMGEFGDLAQIRERLLDNIPDFLKRNIRGRSPSELLFHLFLSFLHDAGLSDSLLEHPEPVDRALTESLAFVNRLLTEIGARSTGLAVLATNGRCLVGLSQGLPLQFLEVRGIPDCQICRSQQHEERRKRPVAHERLRAVIVEADQRPSRRTGWQVIADGAALLVGPHLKVQTTTAK